MLPGKEFLEVPLSYWLLCNHPEISKILTRLFHLICVDEYPDTQDLLYAIIGKIVKAGDGNTKTFFVGDPDQAIYGSIGGIYKTKEEIQTEIGGFPIKELSLCGCYRSCQRIVDFYSNFQLDRIPIEPRGENKNNAGIIRYLKDIDRESLFQEIAKIIKADLSKGTPESEICVVAPRWYLIIPCARQLNRLLPNTNFDAPGLTPFRKSENFWFKVARLLLTEPSSKMYSTRVRWANETIKEIEQHCNVLLNEYKNGRNLLRLINSISMTEDNAIAYLETAFNRVLDGLGIQIEDYKYLVDQFQQFFQDARRRFETGNYPDDIKSVKGMFRERKGIVINTCHGLKGEEFDTVIAFGLLRGFIPHWDVIINDPANSTSSAKRLLYVICSRAKRNLYLIAEVGRRTRTGNPYEPNRQLEDIDFIFDT